ncbi:unnamed protein product [Orchesella dallaii]|uniref:J domain-containing protein n=1 Tax=Orchesella dallaii TaxID=48710 RepID=A0ABP1PZX5_9HEXA
MEDVKVLFGTEDLYEVLEIWREKATDEKCLRLAYTNAALKYHPDKVPAEEREVFTKKFQIIRKAYELLKDEDLKKVYDVTGTWPENEQFELKVSSSGVLDENSILEFKEFYQGSEEERQAIKKYYEEGNGDIFHICNNVFFLNILDDEERVNSIIESLIENDEMTKMSTGIKTLKVRTQRLNKASQEAAEAEDMMQQISPGASLPSLTEMISARMKSREGFVDGLSKKYCKASTSAGKGGVKPKV